MNNNTLTLDNTFDNDINNCIQNLKYTYTSDPFEALFNLFRLELNNNNNQIELKSDYLDQNNINNNINQIKQSINNQTNQPNNQLEFKFKFNNQTYQFVKIIAPSTNSTNTTNTTKTEQKGGQDLKIPTLPSLFSLISQIGGASATVSAQGASATVSAQGASAPVSAQGASATSTTQPTIPISNILKYKNIWSESPNLDYKKKSEFIELVNELEFNYEFNSGSNDEITNSLTRIKDYLIDEINLSFVNVLYKLLNEINISFDKINASLAEFNKVLTENYKMVEDYKYSNYQILDIEIYKIQSNQTNSDQTNSDQTKQTHIKTYSFEFETVEMCDYYWKLICWVLEKYYLNN